MGNTVQALLDAALGQLPEEEVEKVASEDGETVPVDTLLLKVADELEKISSHAAFKSHAAAQSATPAGVDATNKPIGDALKHTPKAVGTAEIKSGKLAKKGSEQDDASDRIRQALITKLRTADEKDGGTHE